MHKNKHSLRPTRRIVFKKLNQFWQGLQGHCYPNGLIEVDPRSEESDLVETIIHELLHREFPLLSEEAVNAAAHRMAEDVWKLGYRRIKE